MEVQRGYVYYYCIAAVFVLFPDKIESKWVEGTIKTKSDWIFLTRFCFLNRVGNLNYFLEYPTTYGLENLAFYYDTFGQWSSVYQQDLTCHEKMKVLDGKNMFPLAEKDFMCSIEERQDQDWYVCSGDIDFSTARDRWWFVVLSKCGFSDNVTNTEMYLHYKIHMTNGDDFMNKEYSADEFYILIVDIIFFGLYLILLVTSIVCAVMLKSRELFHLTYRMYLVSVTIWTLSLLCMIIAWGYYGNTGWTVRPLEITGRVLQMCSNIIFILTLILLAKGHTLCQRRFTNTAVFKITVYSTLYFAATLLIFVWETVLFDPGLVQFYYESPPGYAMIAIILIGWLWFTKSAVSTLRNYSFRTMFYIVFYTVYTIWFWATPVVVLLAMFAMAKWTMEKTANGVQQSIAFTGHLFFLMLMFPRKDRSSFSYSMRSAEKKVTGKSKKGLQTGSDFIISTKESSSAISPHQNIIILSESSLADDKTGGTMLYMTGEASSLADGSIPSNITQTLQSDKLLPSADITLTYQESSSSCPIQPRGSIKLDGIDECNSQL